MATTSSRPPSPSPSALPPIPSSPTFSYASTANPISSLNLPPPPPPLFPHSHLSRSDLEASQTAYSELLSSAKAYRLALAAISVSASKFGSALEACARLKEAGSEVLHEPGGSMSNSFTAKGNCTADSLMAASGVHHLIGNHQQILSETVYRNFEVPLLHELDGWRRKVEEEEVSYQKEVKGMSREIRKLEKEGLRLHRQRKRDVGVFREHLVVLTGKLDGLTGLHGGHSRGLLRDCQDTSLRIVECGAGLVRAEVDIFEALARKGWSGGGLDELLEKGKDLFANEADTVDSGAGGGHGSTIFSILPQNRSILVVEGGDNTSLSSQHKRNDSLLTGVDGMYQSLAGAVRDTDVTSIFSERADGTTGILNRSRGVRPFSPSPMERVRDPLEDVRLFSKGEEEKGRKNGEGEREVGEDQRSARTVVKVTGPGGGEEEVIEEGGHDHERDSESAREMRELERRWSVTDDGVVSE